MIRQRGWASLLCSIQYVPSSVSGAEVLPPLPIHCWASTLVRYPQQHKVGSRLHFHKFLLCDTWYYNKYGRLALVFTQNCNFLSTFFFHTTLQVYKHFNTLSTKCLPLQHTFSSPPSFRKRSNSFILHDLSICHISFQYWNYNTFEDYSISKVVPFPFLTCFISYHPLCRVPHIVTVTT